MESRKLLDPKRNEEKARIINRIKVIRDFIKN